MPSLRSRVIRLAYQNPPLRPHLLPLLKSAGDVIPFAGRAPRNSHTVTLAGDKYVLSTHSGGMMGDLMELPEEAEEGARIIHVRPEDPWKYLWAYDTDHQVLAMWRVSDGNEKEYGSARSQTALLVKLDKKGELNRVTGAQFRAIETAMRAQEEAHTRALEQWVEETKTTSQRDVDALVQEYFDTKVRPAMDRAVSDVERGATPLGFKANPGGFPVDRQMKSYVTGKLYEKLFDLDSVDAYVKSKGVDMDAIDSQATQWARDDVWLDYLKSVLR